MSLGRNILKNTGALGLATVSTMVSHAALVFIVSRFLSVEALGIYSTVMTISYIVSTWGTMGLSNFTSREVAKNLSDTSRYFVHASLLTALASGALMIGLFLLPQVVPSYSRETRLGIYIVSLATFPRALRVVLRSVFLAHQKLEYVTLASLFSSIFHLLVSFFLLYLGYGVISVVVSFVISDYLVILLLFYWMVRHVGRVQWEFEGPFLKQMILDLRTFAFIGVLSALFARPEVVILSTLKTETEVGFYSSALWIVSLWQPIAANYTLAIYPVLTRTYHQSDRQKNKLLQYKSVKYLSALGWPLTIGLITAAHKIILVIFGVDFVPVVGALRILAIDVLLTFLNPVLWRVLFSRNEQNLTLRVQNICLAARLTLNFVLISLMGFLGAAISLVITKVLMTALHLYYVQRDGTHLRIIQNTWRFALASLGMGGFILTLGRSMNLYLLVPSAAVIYVVLIWLFRGFSEEDVSIFLKILRPQKSSIT